MSLLHDLMVKYGTDKHIWGYDPVYERYLEEKRHEVKRVLEIGICGQRDIPNNVVGASLFVWRDYFPNAEIIGLDNDPRWVFNDQQRIRTFLINAYDSRDLHMLMDDLGAPDFDFICDDAVHDPLPQINLLVDLFPYLAAAGAYAMEDVCPYKLPGDDLQHMIQHFPIDAKCEVFATGKPERLLMMRR